MRKQTVISLLCAGVLTAGAVTGLMGFADNDTALAGSAGTEKVQLLATSDVDSDSDSDSSDTAEATGTITGVSDVAAAAMPSVVSITNKSVQEVQNLYSIYGYGAPTYEQESTSCGSGIIIGKNDSELLICTNNHVVEGGSAYKVTIAGETYDAEVVGSDPSSDVAVIKAKDASGLTPIEIGDSDKLVIGEWVMTIGSPFGLEQSVATGIVSATSRSQIVNASTDQYGNSTGESTIYPNMIQTDAAINPGNSGGALVDADGKLIGINTLITSYSGNYSGVGFAIPVNYAVNLAQQIIDGKTPTHAQLGVSLSTVNAQNAKRYGLSVDEGAYVAAVSEGSGAAEAGLQEGDIVTKFDGKDVASASDLMLDVRSKNPGDKVTLDVNRNGETKQVEVTLGSDESSQSASTQQNSAQESMLERLFGGDSGSSQQDAA